MNWQQQAIDLPRLLSAVMPLQTDGSGVEAGLGWGGVGGQGVIRWSMLRDAYVQWPLDGTSETGSVLLRLLKDGLIGAVSITL